MAGVDTLHIMCLMVSRETSCNVELLKYQSLTLEDKISRFENMEAELTKYKLENQVCYMCIYVYVVCVCVCVRVYVCVRACIPLCKYYDYDY